MGHLLETQQLEFTLEVAPNLISLVQLHHL